MSAEDARKKIEAGANLVQIYTGFVYSGPAIIRSISVELSRIKTRIDHLIAV